MLRSIDILMIGLLLGGAAFTYKIKHDSEVAIEKVAELERKIQSERDAIDVLLADWSLLSSPDRLEKLVAKYREQLDLEEVASSQIGSLPQIPEKIELPKPPSDKGLAGLIEENDIVTGTIVDPVFKTPSLPDQTMPIPTPTQSPRGVQ